MTRVDRAVSALVKLRNRARHRYSYFITRAGTGYRWHLVDREGNDVCTSDPFRDKADCLKSLRINQRHAATTDIRDETR